MFTDPNNPNVTHELLLTEDTHQLFTVSFLPTTNGYYHVVKEFSANAELTLFALRAIIDLNLRLPVNCGLYLIKNASTYFTHSSTVPFDVCNFIEFIELSKQNPPRLDPAKYQDLQ